MHLKSVGPLVAKRELTTANGGRITITIGKPKPFPEGTDYYCPYEIVGLGDRHVRYTAGVDAVQALDLALKQVGADLYTSPEARNGTLYWIGAAKPGDLGFPVPDSIRDLLP